MKKRIKYIVLGLYILILLLLDIHVTHFGFRFDEKSVTGQLLLGFFGLLNPMSWFWPVSVITGISGIIFNLTGGVFILGFIDFLITNFKRRPSSSTLIGAQRNQLQMSVGFKVITVVFLLMLTLFIAYAALFGLAYGLAAKIGLIGIGLLYILPIVLSLVGLVAWLLLKKPWGLRISVLSIVVWYVSIHILSLYIK